MSWESRLQFARSKMLWEIYNIFTFYPWGFRKNVLVFHTTKKCCIETKYIHMLDLLLDHLKYSITYMLLSLLSLFSIVLCTMFILNFFNKLFCVSLYKINVYLSVYIVFFIYAAFFHLFSSFPLINFLFFVHSSFCKIKYQFSLFLFHLQQ